MDIENPLKNPRSQERRDLEHARISIRIPGQQPKIMQLSKLVMTLGRLQENDIVLPISIVSKKHGRIEKQNSNFFYRDLESKNGSFLNGQFVQYAQLSDGDIITLGDAHGDAARIVFYCPHSSVDAPLNFIQMRDLEQFRNQGKTKLILGRGSGCDIHLDTPMASRRHAQINLSNSGDILIDLNSTNGTYVNGNNISQPVHLREGDVINIGPYRLIYGFSRVEQQAQSKGVRLDGIEVIRTVGRGSDRHTILNNVNISVYPREFISLVGGSGAGKTTLLRALNGTSRPEGKVLIQGSDLYQYYDIYRSLIGYVPQEDIIHKELSVYHVLHYTAELRLPADTTAQEIDRRIDHVLEQVNMLGQKHQIVSCLSGGQRKRVSIAAELLADPRIFFLDEPTSGLDPGLEKKMMGTMRHLADEGRTIVLVTHATANITQCDHVCFLSYGRMTYFGPPSQAPRFFDTDEQNGFADIYEKLDDPDPQKAHQKAIDWATKFKQSSFYQKYIIERKRTLPSPSKSENKKTKAKWSLGRTLRQFMVLVRRYFDLVFHDKFLLIILLAIMPLIGFLLRLIAKKNWLIGDTANAIEQTLVDGITAGQKSASYMIVGQAQTLLFMLALAVVLLGLFASAYEIVRERPIYERERAVVLRLFPYLASKVVVLGSFAAIQCLLLLLVIGTKVSIPSQGVMLPAFWEMYITLFLSAVAAIMVGLFISANVPNSQPVIYIVLGVLFFQIVFAGVFFEMPGMTKSLSNLTISRWTTESLGISSNLDSLNQLTKTRFIPDPFEQEQEIEIQKPNPTCLNNMPVLSTEKTTQNIQVNPGPIDMTTPETFQIGYSRSQAHLLGTWRTLIFYGLFFFMATLGSLRWQETRRKLRS